MALEFEDHPFWDYSIGVYSTEGIPAACLALQDRHEIDVNVLLFCSWLGHSGRGVMSDADLSSVLDAVDDWNQNVVRGLRAVRQRLKGGLPPALAALSEALRSRILKIEVDSEHAEQLMLAHALELASDPALSADRRAQDAVANISAYFHSRANVCDETDVEQLSVILGAAFTDLDGKRIAMLCRKVIPADAGAD